ncbi:nuclear receptor corepressor 1 [Ditylenchus destructor]|nr:nuclear receptor corepressor 1 [Ditylenchus destructor]
MYQGGGQPPQNAATGGQTGATGDAQQNLLYAMQIQQQMGSLIAAIQQQQQAAAISPVPSVSQQPITSSMAQNQVRMQQQAANYNATVNPLLNLLGLRSPLTQQRPQLSQPQQQPSPQPVQPARTMQTPAEISRRRPSLMSNFTTGSPVSSTISGMDPRYSLLHSQLLNNADNSRPLLNQFATPQIQQSQPDAVDIEDEAAKKALTERMDKLDREKMQMGTALKTATKKMEMCRKIISSNKEPEEDDESEDQDGTGDANDLDSLVDRIYAENKKKAAASNTTLTSLAAPKNSESINLDENLAKGLKILPSLIKAMRIQRNRRNDCLVTQQAEYGDQLAQWEKKVAKYERNPKKIARDAKHREIFEKTFTELKKQREEKERTNRVERSRCSLTGGNGQSGNNTSAATSGNNSNDVEYENVDAKMRSVALIPPMLITPPRRFYENRNGLVENALQDARNKLESFLNIWSDAEKEIFAKRIATYGKNFAAVSAFLPSKSVKDCVLYYYMSKKRNNYKAKFGRKRKKIGRQYRPPIMPQLGDLFSEDDIATSYNHNCSTYVECLLCEARISVFPATKQALISLQPNYDPYGFNAADEIIQAVLPICTKCTVMANKHKSANRCPLGTCGCGKRKIKPVRTIPEKFQGLTVEHKRFIIHRMKLPPSSAKCCNNCNKKITKEIDDLLDGLLKNELNAFNLKLAESGKQKAAEINAASDDEDHPDPCSGVAAIAQLDLTSSWDSAAEQFEQKASISAELLLNSTALKGRTKEETITPVEETELRLRDTTFKEPPFKEIKLEIPDPNLQSTAIVRERERFYAVKKEEDVENKDDDIIFEGTTSSTQQTSSANLAGSITQGTPVNRTFNIKSSGFPYFFGLQQSNASATLGLQQPPIISDRREQPIQAQQTSSRNLAEEAAAVNFLAHFGIQQDNKNASNELSQKLLQSPEILLKQQQLRTSLLGSLASTSNPQTQAQLLAAMNFPTFQSQMINTNPLMSYNTNINPEENFTNSAQLSCGIPFTMASSAKPTVASSAKSTVAAPESISKPKTVKQYLQQQQQQQSATSRRDISRTHISGPTEEAPREHPQTTSAEAGEFVKRKSGIATAVLPTPAYENSATVGVSTSSSPAPMRVPIQKTLSTVPRSVFSPSQPGTQFSTSGHSKTASVDISAKPVMTSTRFTISPSLSTTNTLQTLYPQTTQTQALESKAVPCPSAASIAQEWWSNMEKVKAEITSVLPSNEDDVRTSLTPQLTSSEQAAEEILRSVSVKAESNYGGVSSSCYESLSDSDFEEDDKTNVKASVMPVQDDPKDFPITTMYSVLSLPIVEEKSESSPLHPSISMLALSNQTIPSQESQAGSSSMESQSAVEDAGQVKTQLTKVNHPTISTNTCIYEPLSDDEQD